MKCLNQYKMDRFYKEAQSNLPMDVTDSPSPTITNNKLENGVTQLITAEAWNINPTGIMKKALSPLVAVPASSIMTPQTDPPSGVSLKLAATVLQPICLGDNPMVLPIHLQVAGSSTPQVSPSSNAPWVMTNQGAVPLSVLLEQHLIQHLNSPLLLASPTPSPVNSVQNHIQGAAGSCIQSQPLGQKSSNQMPEYDLPPPLQIPGFPTVLQDFFPSHTMPSVPNVQLGPENMSTGFSSLPQQNLGGLLSPLVPPATLLVPYPVIVPLPVPIPIPIPIPIPMAKDSDPNKSTDMQRKTTFSSSTTNRGTQTSTEKEQKILECIQHRGVQDYQHTNCKFNTEAEALDLSMKRTSVVKKNEFFYQQIEQDGVLDLSITTPKKLKESQNISGNTSSNLSANLLNEPLSHSSESWSNAAPLISAQKVEGVLHATSNSCEFSSQHKWVVDQNYNRIRDDSRTGNNTDTLSGTDTAKVIVSVKDAGPAILCGKIKTVVGVSTKNFSYKTDLSQESVLQCYDVKSQLELRDGKKSSKNRGIKLKKMSSQDFHVLPIKKQRLAAFFARK
ncbi:retinoic acid-induced protein 2 isoform X2 [Pristis pectinata]|nr:retinoic acid-induced protein 2 isoform X2 [Pristis pectinata]XP_051871055.1 retinoic acid-induced protein 2 isoform X2 [Pristis pectinata]XP_051871056.1 retinoic acid-induced protein 2 isoform X2 [Pristis pectinata]XP_051871057.1 retinoic acid-induced protein 2 isoform X2 [Pristis pectinata]